MFWPIPSHLLNGSRAAATELPAARAASCWCRAAVMLECQAAPTSGSFLANREPQHCPSLQSPARPPFMLGCEVFWWTVAASMSGARSGTLAWLWHLVSCLTPTLAPGLAPTLAPGNSTGFKFLPPVASQLHHPWEPCAGCCLSSRPSQPFVNWPMV